MYTTLAGRPAGAGQSMSFSSTSPTPQVPSNSDRPQLAGGSSVTVSAARAPVTQVLKSRIVTPSTTAPAESKGNSAPQPRLRPEGGDLGPQVSRSGNVVENGRRSSASKVSLAAFASSQPVPTLQRISSTGASPGAVWTRIPSRPDPARNPEPNVRIVGTVGSHDDNDLPTLRELVKVGTAGATSSTATANRRIPSSYNTLAPRATSSTAPANRQTSGSSHTSASPTWLGMGVGQPRRFADSNERIPQDPARAGEAVIALDVDEVLVQYVGGFRKYMQQERPNGPLDTDSIFHEAHNPNSPWRLQFALSGGLDNLEAVPGAAVALQRFRSAGIRLEAVTSRPPIMRQSTEALLAKLFPPDTFAAYHFVGPGEKGRTCVSIGARALVDDQFPNCVDTCGCGVTCVLFDYCGSYPWSQNLPEMPPNCKRCETWAETCTFLLALFGVQPGVEVQSSDYLLKVKQAVAERSDAIVDYREALSEAEKQNTEYDFNMDDSASREMQRFAATDQAPRSEPWWQMRDEPQAVVQSSPALHTNYRSVSRHQEENIHSEPWWQMRDEPASASQHSSYQFNSLAPTMAQENSTFIRGHAYSQDIDANGRSRASVEATLDPKAGQHFDVVDYNQARQSYQHYHTSPNLQQPRREPLRTWNSPASAYALEPMKAEAYVGGYPTYYAKAPRTQTVVATQSPNQDEDGMCIIT